MALSETSLAICSKCARAVLPHRVCDHCGFYGGKEIIDVLAKLTKKEKKKRLKEETAEREARGSELNPEKLSKKT